jgi:thiol-disulfide isomerase/thioredoxin
MEYTIIKNMKEYNNILKNDKSIKIVQLYADWCKPCSKISVDMELDDKWLNGKREDIDWIKINVDELEEVQSLEELKEMFSYNKIPTFYFVLDKNIKTSIETSNYDKLCDYIKDNLNKYYYDFDKLMIENFEGF